MQAATLKIVGDWQGKIGVPLADALAVSMEICGRVGEEACKHAIILMAQSAKNLAKKAPARREVKRDERLFGSEYVETWQQGKAEPSRLYRFRFSDQANARDRLEGTWENAKRIKGHGLAGRSWMFGLGKWGHGGANAMPGVSKVFAINRGKAHGYILHNLLSYVTHPNAMPSGWESTVQTSAGNRIMAQAVLKLDTEWRREMNLPRRGKKEPPQDNMFLARYFQS
jgi:hypothetical protein